MYSERILVDFTCVFSVLSVPHLRGLSVLNLFFDFCRRPTVDRLKHLWHTE
jgi:hypothetical protein